MPDGETVTYLYEKTPKSDSDSMPNPDPVDDSGTSFALPPGMKPVGTGAASYYPEGNRDSGSGAGSGIHIPINIAGYPNPETGGPYGPASLNSAFATLLTPNPETGVGVGPMSGLTGRVLVALKIWSLLTSFNQP